MTVIIHLFMDSSISFRAPKETYTQHKSPTGGLLFNFEI